MGVQGVELRPLGLLDKHAPYLPGFLQRCDTHKFQQLHPQSVPRCLGSWFPAVRPQKLCPGGLEPCKAFIVRALATSAALCFLFTTASAHGLQLDSRNRTASCHPNMMWP